MVLGDETTNNKTHRNSLKLDISDASNSVAVDNPKETYRSIPEYPLVETNNHREGDGLNGVAAVKNSNMVRENNDHIEDGAGDAMLAPNEKEQLAQTNEVKFISAVHKNGDAKIDIGDLEKSFTGMTKEELMRFANDPFWVRLRWIFFILFWALWLAMLAGAVYIIIGAPKCAAPTPLPWYKLGPLVKIEELTLDAAHLEELKAVGTKGVIYKLPALETYRLTLNTSDTSKHIEQLIAKLRLNDIELIVDVTPNYVSTDDELYVQALANDTAARSAFVFSKSENVPNKWLSTVGGSAWRAVGTEWVLSQYGDETVDVQLNSEAAKNKFKAVLEQLVKLGVKGVRLENFEHYIISAALKDEVLAQGAAAHDEYASYAHTETTYQPGLRDLISEFADTVRNATAGTGFVSVTNKIVKPEDFWNNGTFSIELPVSGTLPRTLASAYTSQTVQQLFNELTQIVNVFGNKSCVQWQYETDLSVGLSEYNFFLMLLPGVPVASSVEQLHLPAASANSTEPSFISQLEAIRQGPSYMHGNFTLHTDANNTVIAYTRIKSGNPGYFVAYNPSDELVKANFSTVAGIPKQLTVNLVSKNYQVAGIVHKVKVDSNAIPVDAKSVIILTYVPEKK